MKKRVWSMVVVMAMLLTMWSGSVFTNQTVWGSTMYALDGRTLEVNDYEIEAYRQVGWYYGKPVTMYTLDGRTLTIGENDVEMYRQVGWYYGKPVTMYALDGRTLTIGENDVEMYRQVGWYYGKPVTMYAPDGRTLTIGANDVEMYRQVGWYETKVKVQTANKSTVNNSSYSSNSEADGYYYRTPTGKKYHLDPDCGGKNSYRTTNISGLSPCKKCAM